MILIFTVYLYLKQATIKYTGYFAKIYIYIKSMLHFQNATKKN